MIPRPDPRDPDAPLALPPTRPRRPATQPPLHQPPAVAAGASTRRCKPARPAASAPRPAEETYPYKFHDNHGDTIFSIMASCTGEDDVLSIASHNHSHEIDIPPNHVLVCGHSHAFVPEHNRNWVETVDQHGRVVNLKVLVRVVRERKNPRTGYYEIWPNDPGELVEVSFRKIGEDDTSSTIIPIDRWFVTADPAELAAILNGFQLGAISSTIELLRQLLNPDHCSIVSK